MTIKPAVISLLAAVAVMSAACGTTGSDGVAVKSTASSGTAGVTTGPTATTQLATTASTEPQTSTTGGSGPADARAVAANLVGKDFPAGWTSTPHQSTNDTTLIDDCAAHINLDSVTVAKAESDDFAKGDLTTNLGQQVHSSTRVFEDEAAATAVVSVLGDATFVACAGTTVKAEFKGSAVTGSLKPVPNVQGYGDQAAGLQGTFSVTTPAATNPIDVEIALLAIRTRDIATVVTGVSIGGPGDDIFGHLADVIAQRQAG